MSPPVHRAVLVAVVALVAASAHAQERPRRGWPTEIVTSASAEYYEPTHDGRQIRSTFANALVGVEVWNLIHFYAYAGVTATGASGWIVQDDARLDTSVAGAGPVFLLRVEPLRLGPFSLGGELLGGILFYASHFPPGGDIYNFAWRFGGVLGIRVDDRVRVEVTCHWMHVSNGQGLGPFNPSYEAVGAGLGAQITL